MAQSQTLNPKEEHTTQGEHQPRPPRTQRPSPSQRAAHTPPHGSSKRRHLLIPKAPAIPSPCPPGDGRCPGLNPAQALLREGRRSRCSPLFIRRRPSSNGRPYRWAITAERCSAPLAGRPTWPALNLPANRKSPATRGAKGHRALLVDGEPPHREIFSPPTAFTNTSGVSRPASRPLRPSPGPSIACPLPTNRTETHKPHNRRWNIRLGRVRLWRTE